MAVKHPYIPQNIPIEGYVPNELDRTTILAGFFGIACVIFLIAFIIMSMVRQRRGSDKLSFAWFLITGLIHIIIEGYWVFNWKSYTKGSSILDQVWKEYSLADSRYVFAETGVLGIEAITAIFVGPASLLTALLIFRQSPVRHFFQIVVSVCQIYGDYLYFFTAIYPGKHYHVEDDYGIYYWGYFIALNGLWIVIPLAMLIQSFNGLKSDMPSLLTDTQKKKQKLL